MEQSPVHDNCHEYTTLRSVGILRQFFCVPEMTFWKVEFWIGFFFRRDRFAVEFGSNYSLQALLPFATGLGESERRKISNRASAKTTSLPENLETMILL